MMCCTQFSDSGAGRSAALPAAAKRSSSPAPSAFTLVELLVVVVIISMLVGLLLPAVMRARSRARVVQCTNNQKELFTAIMNYETAKQHLPGFANQVHGTNVSWAPVLFPFMGHSDLWEGQYGWRMGNNPPNTHVTYIEQLVCPDDVESTGDARLTYAVNCGLYNDPSTPLAISNPGQGIFRNYGVGATEAKISFSDIKSPSQTVLLSERTYPVKLWNTSTPTPANVGFLWPTPAGATLTTLIGHSLKSDLNGPITLPAPLPAIHPGVVIVTFCDGHIAEIAEDTLCNLYRGVP